MTHKSRSARHASLLAALPLAAVMPPYALAQQGSRYYGHMWDGGWHGWLFGPVMMILLVALVVVGVVLAIRWSGGDGRGGPSGGPPQRTPRDILNERFARGEIDKEEYEERRRILDQ